MIDRLRDVVEKAGLFFEEEGFPRIAGRIFGLLLVSDSPRSIDDIARALRVSKASVSTDARLLERWDVAERVGRPGDRRVYYRIARDLPLRTMEHRVARVRGMRALIEEASAALPGRRAALRDRLSRFGDAYDQALAIMEGALRRVARDAKAGRSSATGSAALAG
jgi:DNA-binding transcriptional regulator GbsR (MarR family)